jgi:hypothetical protein
MFITFLWQPRYPALIFVPKISAGPEALRPKVTFGLPFSVNLPDFQPHLKHNIFFAKRQSLPFAKMHRYISIFYCNYMPFILDISSYDVNITYLFLFFIFFYL